MNKRSLSQEKKIDYILCDRFGKIITSPERAIKVQVLKVENINSESDLKKVTIAISGFILPQELLDKYPTCRITPSFFYATKKIILSYPEASNLEFTIREVFFHLSDHHFIGFSLYVEVVYSNSKVSLLGRIVSPRNENLSCIGGEGKGNVYRKHHCLSITRVQDWLCVPIIVPIPKLDYFKCLLNVTTSMFYTIGDGVKRVFTNVDAPTGFGAEKIIDPEDITFYNLYVNGVLQPSSFYHITKGRLQFLTDDTPGMSVPIIIQFVKVYAPDNSLLVGEVKQFIGVSDKTKVTTFYDPNTDPNEGNCGKKMVPLPSPENFTYIDLYINGVLQPPNYYSISNGKLILYTTNVPGSGVPLILQYVRVFDGHGKKIFGDVSTFCIASDRKSRVFTTHDIQGNSSHFFPKTDYSYSNLFINGVMQPKVNYIVDSTRLLLKTDNIPIKYAPIILQYISLYYQEFLMIGQCE